MRWRDQTAVVVASGPSLTLDDLNVVERHAPRPRVIVVNESWRAFPAADVLYGADPEWWYHRAPRLDKFNGERWSQDTRWGNVRMPGVSRMKLTHGLGVAERGGDTIYSGGNSAYQAMQLAIVWGARRIVFLGLDLKEHDGKRHWHADHVQPLRNTATETLKYFADCFARTAPALAIAGVQVFNASRTTALKAFPCMSIQDALR